MKHILNSILLLTFIISSFAIISCKKEQKTNSPLSIQANDLKLAKMLTNFKERGMSHLKSATEMTIDSAIWYISATANFTYGDASRETENTWTDSCFITLILNNGKISESDVYNKYEAVIDSLKAIYQAKNEENKQLLAVIVAAQNLNENALICKVTSVFAYTPPSLPSCTFNSIDSYCFWYLWQYHPICAGPNTNSTLVTDAAEETQKRIMRCKSVPSGNSWYEQIPDGIKHIDDPLLYPVNPAFPISNSRWAHLYWNSSQYSNFDGCIPPVDLNFYKSKTEELIYNDTQNGGIRPVGSSLIDIDMWGCIKISQQDFTLYMHQAVVRYGILHGTPDPPIDLL